MNCDFSVKPMANIDDDGSVQMAVLARLVIAAFRETRDASSGLQLIYPVDRVMSEDYDALFWGGEEDREPLEEGSDSELIQ